MEQYYLVEDNQFNVFCGTEAECMDELENLVVNYGRERSRYFISCNRWD